MFGKLVAVIDKLNEGNVIEAGNELLSIAKDYEDQDKIIDLLAEIEKEIKEFRSSNDFLHRDDSPFMEMVKKSMEEMRVCRENKLKALILHTLYIISNGNEILLNMIKKANIGKPNTYI
ncbi:hypothetical protein [Saccharolobus shibatae]|uniref:Uncharacterized protein n=2 Tax=Saccharolobus shibatae TaxID=2286 RepID=A0A8F5GVM7_9CREN|nr:hypothetical protein [Saccharolobus shibatae]QXJ27854.1 Uncharacterized protein J5U23_00722 [Saccharolobus shibatae B12]QXJ31169.1 Uncharacterized protein J5U21_00819 [Saccharolobus shibatae]QXJ34184.1 Uncharacterized protein J5U22_00730 [Saccharolobus shibatae]